MIDIQKVLVEDHISRLKADAADVNRGRRRATEEGFGAEGRAPGHPTGMANRVRERVGHWLVGVGEAIAGAPGHNDDGSSVRHAA